MSVKLHRLEPAQGIPNSAYPLIIMERATSQTDESKLKTLIQENGWQGIWTYTVYDYWHYHTGGHELLVCIAGEATIGFGGDDGIEVSMRPGDAVIIPAGVGHKRLSGSNDFAVVGAYPPDQNGKITREGEKNVQAANLEIHKLAVPEQDPLSGERPGALRSWL